MGKSLDDHGGTSPRTAKDKGKGLGNGARDEALTMERPSGSTNAELRRSSMVRILSAASKLFIERGFDSAPIDAIAAEAGLTKGAVYFYFKGKANLLAALLERAEADTVGAIEAALEESRDSGSTTDELVAFLRAQSMVGQEYPDSMLLLMLTSVEFHGRGGPLEARLDRIFARMTSLLEDVISRGQVDGTITRNTASKDIATVVMAVNQGAFLEWHRNRESLRGPDLARALRRMVLHGILSPETTENRHLQERERRSGEAGR